jgi:phosphate transport system permease protein
MVLPLFIRGCEQALRDCPQSYRQAAAGLAISRVGYLRRILLPFAAPGIAGALVISAGRALAETAVLLFTAGYVMRWPESLFDSGRTLAVHIYDLAMNVSGGSPASAATALVLLGFALVIQLLAWRLGKRPLSFAR